MATIATRAQRKKSFITYVIISVLLVAAIIITVLSFNQNRSNLFEDQNFARAVAAALNKAPSEITTEDLEAITVLGIITNTNSQTNETTTTLTLGNGDLADLLETDTTEESFDSSTYNDQYNSLAQSTDLTADFKSLDDLILFPNLTVIDVQSQELLKNLNAIKTMKNLEHLSIGNTGVKNISDIAELTNLTYINIQSLGLSDISVLSNLTNLESLYMASNKVTDLAPISNLTKLETLVIDDNYITVVSDTSETSDVSDTSAAATETKQPISHEPIKNLTALKTLRMGSCALEDISALSGLVNLEGLYAPKNNITDISAIAGCTKIETLDLSENAIVDITALKYMANAKQLSLSTNKIADISALSALKDVEYLYLSDNEVVDVSPIKDMTKMAYLYLSNNKITDVSSLVNYTDDALKVIYITGNELTNGDTLKTKYTKAYIMFDETDESETSGDTSGTTSGDTSEAETSDTSASESTADESTAESVTESTTESEG